MLAVAVNTHQMPPSRSSGLSLAASPLWPPAGVSHLPTWNRVHRPVCSKQRRSSPLPLQSSVAEVRRCRTARMETTNPGRGRWRLGRCFVKLGRLLGGCRLCCSFALARLLSPLLPLSIVRVSN